MGRSSSRAARGVLIWCAASVKFALVPHQSSHGLPIDRGRDFGHRLIITFIRHVSEKNRDAVVLSKPLGAGAGQPTEPRQNPGLARNVKG